MKLSSKKELLWPGHIDLVSQTFPLVAVAQQPSTKTPVTFRGYI